MYIRGFVYVGSTVRNVERDGPHGGPYGGKRSAHWMRPGTGMVERAARAAMREMNWMRVVRSGVPVGGLAKAARRATMPTRRRMPSWVKYQAAAMVRTTSQAWPRERARKPRPPSREPKGMRLNRFRIAPMWVRAAKRPLPVTR